MDEATQPGMELPRYKCHKEVWALKIADIEMKYNRPDGLTSGAVITPADPGYATFEVSEAYVRKHLFELTKSQMVGGYYVVYEDGYKSFSPAKAFEDGYTRL